MSKCVDRDVWVNVLFPEGSRCRVASNFLTWMQGIAFTTGRACLKGNGYVWVNVRFFYQANTTGRVAQTFLAHAQ